MNKYFQTIKILALALVLSVGVSVVYAWVGPTATPPEGNTPTPINISENGQIKDGGLLVGNIPGLTNGLLVRYGNVGIGTTAPSGVLDVYAGGVPYEKAGASCNVGDTLVAYKTTSVTCTGDSKTQGNTTCPGSSCTTGSHESLDPTLETCSYKNAGVGAQSSCGFSGGARTCSSTLSVKCVTARKSMFSVASSGMVSASNIAAGSITAAKNVTSQTIDSTGLASLASLKVSGEIHASGGQTIYSCPTFTDSTKPLRHVLWTTCIGSLSVNPTCQYVETQSGLDTQSQFTTVLDCTPTGRMVGL